MDFSYNPKRIIETANDIALQHKKKREVNYATPNDKLRVLIERIVSLELYQVKQNALALPEDDILLIAGYLPHNYYNVEMKNLFLVFGYRSSQHACEVLYEQWQSAYDNEQCNKYMQKQLVENEKFIMLMRRNNLSESTFDEILNADIIPSRFGMECVNRQFPNGYSLLDKMNYFGVRENTRLYHDCQFLFYTFCNKQDYLSANKTELLNVIQRYEEVVLKKFLYRFLNMLTLKELERFEEMARYFSVSLGEITTSKGKAFFEEASIEVKEKYRDWLNRFKINQYFGNDSRSRFWKQYQFKSVEKFNISNAVLMEFERYYAIEFLGDSMGPIYIYQKDKFENYVRRWMRMFNNAELRQQLFHQPDLYFYRREHRGNWQWIVNAVLINNFITEKVRW